MVRSEGVGALATGLGATCCRNGVWNTVYFGAMFRINGMLPAPTSTVQQGSQTLMAGFVGGVLATCFNCPFDVAKSRIQQAPAWATSAGAAEASSSTFQVCLCVCGRA